MYIPDDKHLQTSLPSALWQIARSLDNTVTRDAFSPNFQLRLCAEARFEIQHKQVARVGQIAMILKLFSLIRDKLEPNSDEASRHSYLTIKEWRIPSI